VSNAVCITGRIKLFFQYCSGVGGANEAPAIDVDTGEVAPAWAGPAAAGVGPVGAGPTAAGVVPAAAGVGPVDDERPTEVRRPAPKEELALLR
jgi:hypothetical protein